MISFDLVDMSLEVYAKALNDATVVTTAAASGAAGFKEWRFTRGERLPSSPCSCVEIVHPMHLGRLDAIRDPKSRADFKPRPWIQQGLDGHVEVRVSGPRNRHRSESLWPSLGDERSAALMLSPHSTEDRPQQTSSVNLMLGTQKKAESDPQPFSTEFVSQWVEALQASVDHHKRSIPLAPPTDALCC